MPLKLMSTRDQERRKAKRIRTYQPIDFKDSKKLSTAFKSSTTKNISTTGVLFTSEKPFPINTLIQSKLYLQKAETPITIKLRVTRVEEIQQDGIYEIGTIIKQITKKDKQVFENYINRIDIDELLAFAADKEASDIHLLSNRPPLLRIYGDLVPIDMPTLDFQDIQDIGLNLINEKQKETLVQNREVDTAYTTDNGIRSRLNIHFEKGVPAISLRLIPTNPPSLAKLYLPPVVANLTKKRKGLIIVSGPSGSGKSTTLAAMINLINLKRKCMIISVEDPIEFLHKEDKAYIQQRELGLDTPSYKDSLKHIMRQDPDVIYIGEIRDYESLNIALAAAETGHLVLTTMHTNEALQTINRILDMYPFEQQRQVRSQLAEALEAIISQTLLKKKIGKGRIISTEVLIGTSATKNAIRTGNIEQLYSIMQTNVNEGMQTMDMSIQQLLANNFIDLETALLFAKEPKTFIP